MVDLEPPRFEDGKPLLIAGLSRRYAFDDTAGIPAQWQRFGAHIGHVPGQVGATTYGVCSHGAGEDSFQYLSGVEVADLSGLPDELSGVRIAAQRYAVFRHREHVSTIHRTVDAIWSRWLPASGHEAAAAADFFARYGEGFDPQSGMGGVEIWIPIKA
jgi:AraC family transcriptional regulator